MVNSRFPLLDNLSPNLSVFLDVSNCQIQRHFGWWYAIGRALRMFLQLHVYLIIMIKYWVHHHNDIAFLSIVLGSTAKCYVEVWVRGLTYRRLVRAQYLAVGSGAHISF